MMAEMCTRQRGEAWLHCSLTPSFSFAFGSFHCCLLLACFNASTQMFGKQDSVVIDTLTFLQQWVCNVVFMLSIRIHIVASSSSSFIMHASCGPRQSSLFLWKPGIFVFAEWNYFIFEISTHIYFISKASDELLLL
jgi:hypothetical protein